MDFALTEQQEMLRKSARDFLAQQCPPEKVKELVKSEKGYSPELWRQMKDLGWLGIAYPEKYGGLDGTFLDLAVLCEEMGYACFPGPYLPTVVLSGLAILDAGSEEQRKKYLTAVANGEAILTLALIEGSARYDAASVRLAATPANNAHTLSGTKVFVPFAHVADHILCAARTGPAPDNVTLFIAEAKRSGLSCTTLKSMGYDKPCEVVFDKVIASDKDILGAVNRGWVALEKARQRTAAAKCAEMTGGAQRVLEMATEYSKERQQFGRPIGSFQAIQHQCADMAMDVKASRLLTYRAAWRLAEGLPGAREVAMAKAWVSEAYVRVTYFGAKIHGAIGLTADHNIPLYFKHSKASEPFYGDPDFHREAVASTLF